MGTKHTGRLYPVKVAIVGVIALTVMTAGPSWAAITNVSPSSATVQQGDAISATVTLNTSLSCVVGTADDPTIGVVFTDPVGGCSVGAVPWTATMTVQTSSLTPVGSHTVTIREVNVLGVEVNTATWPIEVTADFTATTTTTSTTTTSTTAAPTTTTSVTSSTTSAPTTTAAPGTTTSTTTTPPGVPTTSLTTTTAPDSGTTGPTTPSSGDDGDGGGLGGSSVPPSSTPPADDGSDDQTDAISVVVSDDDMVQLPGASLSSAARRFLAPLLPPLIVDGMLSPLFLAEIVLGAILDSGYALILPTILTLLAAGLLIWRASRRREEADTTTEAGHSFLPPWLRERGTPLVEPDIASEAGSD